MRIPTLDELRAAMLAKGYPFFERGDFNMNTVAIRAKEHDQSGEAAGNRFNDLLCQAFRHGGAWELHAYACTTVPGDYYLRKPMNEAFGTAIIVPGFYQGSHMLGLHYGKPALQQVGRLSLYRDGNHDTNVDMDPATAQDTASAGVNVHYGFNTQTVDNGSAGCVELQLPAWAGDYHAFIGRYQSAIACGFPNRFSLCVLLETDIWPGEKGKEEQAPPPARKAKRQEG